MSLFLSLHPSKFPRRTNPATQHDTNSTGPPPPSAILVRGLSPLVLTFEQQVDRATSAILGVVWIKCAPSHLPPSEDDPLLSPGSQPTPSPRSRSKPHPHPHPLPGKTNNGRGVTPSASAPASTP